MENDIKLKNNTIYNGNLFIFHSYDVGDDINLEALEKSNTLMQRPLELPKYFKDYHQPLEVEVPHPHEHSAFHSTKIHNFGAISLTYKFPFECSLHELKEKINEIDSKFIEYSISDASSVFKKIRKFIVKPKFYLMRNSYLVIQIDPENNMDLVKFRQDNANTITSLLRFESEHLSDYQKNEILKSEIGYYKGDLIIIDTEAALVVDDEPKDVLDLIEFASIQQLELKYFDRILNKQLTSIYERKIKPISFKSYIPFIRNISNEAVEALETLKVDISVITEQLESSIMTADDVFYSDVYNLLVNKLDIENWKKSIDRKLAIIKDILTFYKMEIESTREDLLSILVIILIFIELVIGIFNLLKH